jgi:NAD(P)-dependent dehydrogenase (short-subunit alcohol dehydrogenase family)
MSDLVGKRVLVVGASSGIGRETALQLAKGGARVAFAARRLDRLEKAVEAAGEHCVAISCDVRRDEDCESAVGAAAGAFGGLDAVVYASGHSPLTRSHEATGELWRSVIETNVIGAAMIARHAIPHLQRSGGRLMLLGSSSVGRPYPGLVPYTTSKAALHEMARGLRNEYPWLRVTTFIVGPTMTEFADGWDMDLAIEMHGRWNAEGYPANAALPVEEMAAEVVAVLASPARVEEVLVMPDVPAPEPGSSAPESADVS